MARSMDGGKSWQRVKTPADWAETNSLPCIYRLTGSDGKERLIVFSVERCNSSSTGPMTLTKSEDDGKTWSAVELVALPCHSPFTSIVRLKDGRYLGVYDRYAKSGPPKTSVWQAVSADGGLTWGEEKCVCSDTRRPSEPEVIRSPDGNQLLCLMRAYRGSKSNRVFFSLGRLSDNEGGDWKQVEVHPGLVGERHKACYTHDQKRLVVVFRDKAPCSPWEGHFVAWVGTYEDIIEGRPGQYRVKLLHTHEDPQEKEQWRKRDSGYAGLELLEDGAFVATTHLRYCGGRRGNSIVSVRFKLDDLDRRAGAFPNRD